MNSGKPGAVQTDHRKMIGSMPQNNCDPAPTPADSSLKRPRRATRWRYRPAAQQVHELMKSVPLNQSGTKFSEHS
jgi:hypothetical protein